MPLKKKKKSVAKKKSSVRKKTAVKRTSAPKKRVVKKKAVRKSVKRAVKKAARAVPENVIGKVTHYFPHVMAAVIKLKAPLNVGETIKIKGHTTDFTQPVLSMQMDHVSINSAKKGQEIGLEVKSRVRQHDIVCKI